MNKQSNKKGNANQLIMIILAVVVLLLMIYLATNFVHKGSDSVSETFNINKLDNYSKQQPKAKDTNSKYPGIIEDQYET
jgi:flagellar basal body-associated protein FliL